MTVACTGDFETPLCVMAQAFLNRTCKEFNVGIKDKSPISWAFGYQGRVRYVGDRKHWLITMGRENRFHLGIYPQRSLMGVVTTPLCGSAVAAS
jgi:hypothetical protein